ncbi:adenosylcobinamide-GDP ribazoletransferase [Sphingomonadales bacterium 56]|jgi:adenosylcobinamide-GDP ribazoletransferase|uniref:adenosylcobinamide-GDP ribazoletransferase n=1 Tax=Sphingomonadales TaxID=204457 RepID=UPI000BE25CD6|nr:MULTISPECIES: adenosylcobinamide-GDP ribazoletransferase [Sphingomonadaceae]MBY2930612.1 adenosylcobinamide-GDP ribazoletransferase [Sphingomonadales bacterium 56]MBY2960552.1 adenosylcobinamide-GDP ribazoletransferase [Sphingomonadales bacterium 58]CAD7341435.1 Adenosylcobinamide-GDP ribazoletransferase [Sphingobium sp. S8]CAD7341636.1 Adenosylcobinamide-GDP ribazoletransferase [Sphingobium sp. S6]
MTRLILALQLMTRLPLPNVGADENDFAAAIRWFPATGIIVGLTIAAAMTMGLQSDPWIAALLSLIAWVAMTGALHLDGLGDMADGAGAAHHDREKLSAVLADPHIGSFGVVSIALQLLTKLVLLRLCAEHVPPLALVAVPFAARIGPLAWTLWLPPLHQGLASRFRDGIGASHLLGWVMLAAALCLIIPPLLSAALFIPFWAWWLRSRIGGISGDGHGAGIELVESGLLFALVLAR